MAHALTIDGRGLEGLFEGPGRRAAKPPQTSRRRATPQAPQASKRQATPAAPKPPAASKTHAVQHAARSAAANAAQNAEKNAGDRDLVAALAGGGRGAWNDFVGRFAGVVYAAAQRRLVPAGRADEVEDVVQEVFLRLCKADFRLLRSYDPARARLSTWLTVVTTSAAIDHLRRRRLANVAIDDAPESCLAVEDPAFENIKIPEGLLSGRQALVLELLYKRDLEVADAAEIMRIDPQTVRSTHHKALTKLRAHFRAIGEVPG